MSFYRRPLGVLAALALLLGGCPERNLSVAVISGDGSDTRLGNPGEFPELDGSTTSGSGDQDGSPTEMEDSSLGDASGSGEEDVSESGDAGEDATEDPCLDMEPCDDGNPCTDDFFDEETCTCDALILVDAPCDDGIACTVGDLCDDTGACGGTPLTCDDDNPCTDDACDEATGGCVNAPNTAPCDDGDLCGVDDVCNGGSCQGGTPVVCDDDNPCTDDSCDPATGCMTTDNAAPCEDGDPCTGNDLCAGGSCTSGALLGCGENAPCSLTTCDGETFVCLSTPQAPELEYVDLNGAIAPGEVLAEDLLFPFQCSWNDFSSDNGYVVTRDPDVSKVIQWDDMVVQVTYPSPTTVEVTLIASWVEVPMAMELSSIVCGGISGVGPVTQDVTGTTTMNQLTTKSVFEWQQDDDGTWFPIVQTQSQNAVNVEINADCSILQQVCDDAMTGWMDPVVNALATHMQDAIPATLKSKLGANKCPEGDPCATNHCGNPVCEMMSPICEL